MPASILATKLYIPPPRPRAVARPRLLPYMALVHAVMDVFFA